MEKVVITGASGFVGGFVYDKVLSDGKYTPIPLYQSRPLPNGMYLNLGKGKDHFQIGSELTKKSLLQHKFLTPTHFLGFLPYE